MWRPQHYRSEGKKRGVSRETLRNALATASLTAQVNAELPPVLTLRHLAYLADVDYGFLRAVVSRRLQDPYKIFRIAKTIVAPRSQSFRVICIPEPDLLKVQRWIAHNILALAKPHSASYAYAKNCKVKDAAEIHCGAQWLMKLDVLNFFESISEISAFRVFRGLGYQPLPSFEMARLCTRLGGLTARRRRKRWIGDTLRYSSIFPYRQSQIGHLPQGAPTSPMLSNLAMHTLDCSLERIADDTGLAYTRYADDLCFSSDDIAFSRDKARHLVGRVYKLIGEHGLSPNLAKTHISPPGSRKVVLGLLVDGPKPRLTREFRAKLRQHIYYLRHPSVGPVKHAAKRGFDAVLGLRHHIEGLIAYASDVDANFARQCSADLRTVQWPL